MKKTLAAVIITLIFVSVAGNIFFMGYFFGETCNSETEPVATRGPHHPHHMRLNEIANSVNPEKKELCLTKLRAMRKNMRQQRPDMMKTRNELMEVLTAEEFDPKAFKAKSDQMHMYRMQMRENFISTITSLASELDRDDRMVLVDSMHMGPPHHRGGPPHGKPRGPRFH